MNRWKKWIAQLRSSAQTVSSAEPILEDDATDRYLQIYRGTPPWLSECGGHTLHLAGSVCRELARTACAEMRVEFDQGMRGMWLARQTEKLLASFSAAVGGVLGVGEGMFLVSPAAGGGVTVSFFLPDRYTVEERDDAGKVRVVSFFEDCMQDGEKYLCKETHTRLEGGRYTVTNKAYRLTGGRRSEVPLSAVKRFAKRPAYLEMEGMTDGCFVEWRLSGVQGRQGEPIYLAGLDLMQDADRQYERLLWEFEGGELAVDASEEAFRMDEDGQPVLPLGKDRLFRMNAIDAGSDTGEMIKVFSPALRDESLIRGLNRILMFFEDAVGIARGTVSDPAVTCKTATEVRSARQRTYLTVVAIQREAKNVLGQIVLAMDRVCSLYRFCRAGRFTVKVSFSDSVLSEEDGKAAEEDMKDQTKGGERYDA